MVWFGWGLSQNRSVKWEACELMPALSDVLAGFDSFVTTNLITIEKAACKCLQAAFHSAMTYSKTKMASASTNTPLGKLLMPTAARAG